MKNIAIIGLLGFFPAMAMAQTLGDSLGECSYENTVNSIPCGTYAIGNFALSGNSPMYQNLNNTLIRTDELYDEQVTGTSHRIWENTDDNTEGGRWTEENTPLRWEDVSDTVDFGLSPLTSVVDEIGNTGEEGLGFTTMEEIFGERDEFYESAIGGPVLTIQATVEAGGTSLDEALPFDPYEDVLDGSGPINTPAIFEDTENFIEEAREALLSMLPVEDILEDLPGVGDIGPIIGEIGDTVVHPTWDQFVDPVFENVVDPALAPVREILDDYAPAVQEVVEVAAESVVPTVNAAIDAYQGLISPVAGLVGPVNEQVAEITSEALGTAMPTVNQTVEATLGASGEAINNFLNGSLQGFLDRFGQGGG